MDTDYETTPFFREVIKAFEDGISAASNGTVNYDAEHGRFRVELHLPESGICDLVIHEAGWGMVHSEMGYKGGSPGYGDLTRNITARPIQGSEERFRSVLPTLVKKVKARKRQ
tara:strand:- start:1367 stop:1705 length:339 start_codon:yes stop_codon:yes gene_type:complete